MGYKKKVDKNNPIHIAAMYGIGPRKLESSNVRTRRLKRLFGEAEPPQQLNVGKHAKGFKFDGYAPRWEAIGYTEEMDDYIGVVGVIIQFEPTFGYYRIEFPNGRSFGYPAELTQLCSDG